MWAIAVQPDGKITAVGETAAPGGRTDFAVVRYNGDGSLDHSFDNDGKVVTQVGSGGDVARSVVIANSGNIVAGGQCESGSSPFTVLVSAKRFSPPQPRIVSMKDSVANVNFVLTP